MPPLKPHPPPAVETPTMQTHQAPSLSASVLSSCPVRRGGRAEGTRGGSCSPSLGLRNQSNKSQGERLRGQLLMSTAPRTSAHLSRLDAEHQHAPSSSRYSHGNTHAHVHTRTHTQTHVHTSSHPGSTQQEQDGSAVSLGTGAPAGSPCSLPQEDLGLSTHRHPFVLLCPLREAPSAPAAPAQHHRLQRPAQTPPSASNPHSSGPH